MRENARMCVQAIRHRRTHCVMSREGARTYTGSYRNKEENSLFVSIFLACFETQENNKATDVERDSHQVQTKSKDLE